MKSIRTLPFFAISLMLIASCDGGGFLPSGGDYCTGEWNTCKTFFDNKLAMERDDVWGYVDKDGEEVIDFTFAAAAAFANGVALVKTGTLTNIIDADGETLIPGGYSYIRRDVDDRIMYYGDSTGFGLLSEAGVEITEKIFKDRYGEFIDGLMAVSADEINYGYINKTGSFAIPAEYEEAYQFTRGLGLVKEDGLYGFVDTDGDMAIEAIYQDAYSFDDYDRAIVQFADESYGLINKSGDALIEDATDIMGSGPLYEVHDSQGNQYLYKADGSKFIDQSYSYISIYHDYLANVEWEDTTDHDEVILFNPNGTIAYSVPYMDSDEVISTDNKAYLIDDTDGLKLYSYDYEITLIGNEVRMITDEYIVYHNGTAVGAVTLEDNPRAAIPFEYTNLVILVDDYAIAMQNSAIGVIDLDGDVVIPFEYDNFNITANL